MKITKYEHACLDIDVDGKRLLIDPGMFTSPLPSYENIVAVIVTHAHGDHLDPKKLQAVRLQNPEAVLYSVQQVADEIKGIVPTVVVNDGFKTEINGFELEFFGTEHAVIHESLPKFQNVGVMVNNTLYYPGDSFTLPNKPVEVLAVPVSAPWMKMSEAIDFVIAVKPKRTFATHNAILSEAGMGIADRYMPMAGEKVGAVYSILKPGDLIEV